MRWKTENIHQAVKKEESISQKGGRKFRIKERKSICQNSSDGRDREIFRQRRKR
jgi:hypothetical protein